jgi:hypothetical protein
MNSFFISFLFHHYHITLNFTFQPCLGNNLLIFIQFNRLAEQKALQQVAACFSQEVSLLFRFDPLSQYFQTQFMGNFGDFRNQKPV